MAASRLDASSSPTARSIAAPCGQLGATAGAPGRKLEIERLHPRERLALGDQGGLAC
jgi:hypothetical protein